MISMNRQINVFFTLALAALMITSALALSAIIVSSEDSGGTDSHIAIDGNAGGSGQFEWNEIHGFVITEDHDKVNEEFDVVVCENRPKYNNDNQEYQPSGYIFGEVTGIEWTDDPEPSIEVTEDDFYAYTDDGINLTVYILGSYEREGPGGTEVRQAYKDVLVQRPNHAPKAVAMVVDCDDDGNGNWTGWKNAAQHDELTYYTSAEGNSVKFYLNGSDSWDEDGDNITEYRWDLDGDNKFGGESREREMNTTVFLGVGSWKLGLMVGDGHKYSSIVDINILIRTPKKYPDLTVIEISTENYGVSDTIEKGDKATVRAQVKNIGDSEANESFSVLMEYKYMDTNEDYEYMDTLLITDVIIVNEVYFAEFVWDTGKVEYLPGTYRFRAEVDVDDDQKELRETNNIFESENQTLEPPEFEYPPELSISGEEQSATAAAVNDIVYINITVKNDGDGPAKYVDLRYYIDNEYQYTAPIDLINPDGDEKMYSFVFSGDTIATYRMYVEVWDDGLKIATSKDFSVAVSGEIHDKTNVTDPTTDEEDEGNMMIPIAIGAVVVIAGVGGAIGFFMKKKDEDVW